MSATRQALSQIHPAKTNVLSVALICILILIVSLQIWLLSASLNTSLGGETNIAWPAFYASVALFLASLVTLSYLPLPIRLPIIVEREEAFTHAALAWRTLGISAVSLGLAFAVWFMWSAITVKLNDVGIWSIEEPAFLAYSYASHPRFLAAHSLRSHCFALWQQAQLCGRNTPALVSCPRVRDPKTPYGVLLLWSALTGIAGANFATSMATVTLWFPKKLQGSALGINGLGNLGVTVAQFTIPLVIGFSLAGAATAPSGTVAPLHLENAGWSGCLSS